MDVLDSVVFVAPEHLLSEVTVADADVSICVLLVLDNDVFAKQGQQKPKILDNTWE